MADRIEQPGPNDCARGDLTMDKRRHSLGETRGASSRPLEEIGSDAIGLAFATTLIIGSFAVAAGDFVWDAGVPAALIVLAFGVLIVFLVSGPLWIMAHLNADMMPMTMSRGMM